MKEYRVTLTGLTPLLLHNDNLAFAEKVNAWRRDPGNKEMSRPGDDRSPGWSWLGYTYHDGRYIGVSADNLMTMLRDGGAKVKTGKGPETYKKQTQAGINIHDQQWPILMSGRPIEIKPIWDALMGVSDPERFFEHLDTVEKAGFELSVRRAKVGRNKHVRVRPMFTAGWQLIGNLMIADEETSGLSTDILSRILNQAGSLIGLGDWRPLSPQASGSYGRFEAAIDVI